jgi:hypothetical protein
MVLEWIRRRDSKFDEFLRKYLFTGGDILAIEEATENASAASPRLVSAIEQTTEPEVNTFTVGSLRPKRQ